MLNWVLLLFVGLAQIAASVHALFYKRDPKAAWAWIVTCMLLPPFGPVLYVLLGINRVQTKAQQLKWQWPFLRSSTATDEAFEEDDSQPPELEPLLARHSVPSRSHIAQISQAVTQRPLLGGNLVQPLYNGEQAYPSMLAAINRAKSRVYLATYIFDTDKTGRRFIRALTSAVERGVEVKVLLDGVGEYYSRPRAGKLMQRQGIPFARFLPVRLTSPFPFLNLRNHRKLLIVDGNTGFTGGMNIGDRHLLEDSENKRPARDVHFLVQGPVVSQMEEAFLEDWGFATRERQLPLSTNIQAHGEATCRTITVGPNEDLNKLNVILSGAVSVANRSINIMTPYFLPPRELIGALQTAALRGIEVNIVLPEKNNLPFVHWATRNMLWELLTYGVRVFYQPPPFTHSKLFVLDDYYTILGSANLDPRSLRLNFEVVLEVFDSDLGCRLSDHIRSTISVSQETSLEEVDSRPYHERFRDSLCWIFSPYF